MYVYPNGQSKEQSFTALTTPIDLASTTLNHGDFFFDGKPTTDAEDVVDFTIEPENRRVQVVVNGKDGNTDNDVIKIYGERCSSFATCNADVEVLEEKSFNWSSDEDWRKGTDIIFDNGSGQPRAP